MIQLHPEFLKKNGQTEFVVLPYEEFLAIQELLEDLADLQALRTAKQEEGDQTVRIPLAEVKWMLNSDRP